MAGRVVAIIGGGAAGYFAAISCAETFSDATVTIYEGTRRPLTKVRISGGGRCNVTHNCFDVRTLVTHYPRGSKELLGPFSRFQPQNTIAWFEKRGVKIKAEADGRMFPTTDSSETIIECLQKAAADAGVSVELGVIVKGIKKGDGSEGGFVLKLADRELTVDCVLLATGSAPHGHRFAKDLGNRITDLAPSLFTFNIQDPRLSGIPGISFPSAALTLEIPGSKQSFKQTGPLLITHWGLSGPAVLKLSAFAAHELFASNYGATLKVNFLPMEDRAQIEQSLLLHKQQNAKKNLANALPFNLPKRFMLKVLEALKIEADQPWSSINHAATARLIKELCEGIYAVSGKGEFKDEFVTCGGVDRRDVDFRTMESKRCKGLYFAGEILDIDGITGGFNFQNAWTTGWIAGRNMLSE